MLTLCGGVLTVCGDVYVNTYTRALWHCHAWPCAVRNVANDLAEKIRIVCFLSGIDPYPGGAQLRPSYTQKPFQIEVTLQLDSCVGTDTLIDSHSKPGWPLCAPSVCTLHAPGAKRELHAVFLTKFLGVSALKPKLFGPGGTRFGPTWVYVDLPLRHLFCDLMWWRALSVTNALGCCFVNVYVWRVVLAWCIVWFFWLVEQHALLHVS